MIVVADTSPLNYLVLIDEVDLLPALFGEVLTPQAVFQELKHPKTPAKVQQWISHFPAWLEVRTVASVPIPALMKLDIGEREAIQLALELGISTVLLDETDGRQEAKNLHLEVRGTLGILERGAKLGKINFRQALSKLEQSNFRISPAVRSAFLKRNP
jgi:predicted nucleic acid-binding protein